MTQIARSTPLVDGLPQWRYLTVKAVDANTFRVCTVRGVEASAVRDTRSVGMDGSAVMVDAGHPRLNAGDRFPSDFGDAYLAIERWNRRTLTTKEG